MRVAKGLEAGTVAVNCGTMTSTTDLPFGGEFLDFSLVHDPFADFGGDYRLQDQWSWSREGTPSHLVLVGDQECLC